MLLAAFLALLLGPAPTVSACPAPLDEGRECRDDVASRVPERSPFAVEVEPVGDDDDGCEGRRPVVVVAPDRLPLTPP